RRGRLGPKCPRRVRGLQAAALAEPERVDVEDVPARLRDHVQVAARETAVLRVEAAGLHLHFLDEVGIQLLAFGAGLDAGRVQPLDDVAVLGAGRAVYRRSVGVLRDAGREARHRVDVAAHGELFHQLLPDAHAAHRRRRVDDGRGAGDVD